MPQEEPEKRLDPATHQSNDEDESKSPPEPMTAVA
jgi:hypothetical protein